ncbi:hypothetical protein RFI_11070 [Reticulomyxa filosa]|uniref:Nucleolar protein 16 n=1 Tax=Reticulomyxa filosa TaxID=46433 RepID=X6NK18_RETFI|nr:hypothetical protein RFI_11070 [Reticulomyxa filosa]|eukprot:ETO26069.1 hypothetical protein RFI_11070 [Reticulomyxa filosa]
MTAPVEKESQIYKDIRKNALKFKKAGALKGISKPKLCATKLVQTNLALKLKKTYTQWTKKTRKKAKQSKRHKVRDLDTNESETKRQKADENMDKKNETEKGKEGDEQIKIEDGIYDETEQKQSNGRAEENDPTDEKSEKKFKSAFENALERLTPAEKQFLSRQKEMENYVISKQCQFTHRQKIEKYNKQLSELSEHYDVPKVGPG